MDLTDYNFITLRNLRLLAGHRLANQQPRTLLLGDTRDGHTLHVYLGEDGIIHRLEYVELSTGEYAAVSHSLEHEQRDNAAYIPDHRLNPACCDLEVCVLLKAEELMLPFSEWQDAPAGLGPFYGKTCRQLSFTSILTEMNSYPPQWPDSESPDTTARFEADLNRGRVPYYRNRADGRYLMPAGYVGKAQSLAVTAKGEARLAA
jgi:hypothetical protein